MTRPASTFEDDAIAFGEKVFALLAETRYTTTYKLAVLLGLMDLCLENTTSGGSPPDVITTRQLAGKVTEIYWPHTLPFGARVAARVLRQGSSGQAEILSCIEHFRSRLRDGSVTLMKARIDNNHAYSRLLDQIEWKLIEMPLPRLQTIGITPDQFIYQIHWDKGVAYSDVTAYQKGRGNFDNRILLKPGVAERLIRLNGLLRPLIHRRWAMMVATLNGHEESRLEGFLFGADRLNLSRARGPLWELHEGRCFYCQNRIHDPAKSEVDHFIPWSRYQENSLSNLVIADTKCNSNKSDFLAADEHIARWMPRFDSPSRLHSDLMCLSSDLQWDFSPARTLSVARAIYLRVRKETKLWRIGREFIGADPERISKLLAGQQP